NGFSWRLAFHSNSWLPVYCGGTATFLSVKRSNGMEVRSFTEIEEEFMNRVRRIVWCTVATVNRQGRPRSRILHTLREGSTRWIATNRHSLKGKHLQHNPHVSLSYWDQQ